MEQEMNVLQMLRAVIQDELTAQARNEARAANARGREEGSPSDLSAPNSPFDASAVCAFHMDCAGSFSLLQRAASIPR